MVEKPRIYFAGHFLPEEDGIYNGIVKSLETKGIVIARRMGDVETFVEGHDKRENYLEITDLLDDCNFAVFDLSNTGRGTEFLIGRAVEKNRWLPTEGVKPILVLRQRNSPLPVIIAGCSGLKLRSYNDLDSAVKEIGNFFRYVSHIN